MNSTNINEDKFYLINLNFLFISLIKSSLSLLFSFILGFERELHSHPGGICTHTLVGLGSCLFTMISVNLKNKYPSDNSDPARICAQIVSGMGFLGSATIFKSNNYVKGINTAANLWISAAVSMAIGADLWEFGAVISIYTIFILLINAIYKKIRYKNKNIDIQNNEILPHEPEDAPYGDETKNNIIE
jgi:putative Mg2+ transporter-C (MgtC) family protein